MRKRTGWTRERTRWTRERSSWTRTVWFGSATKSDIKRLHQTVRTAERNICAPLPNLQYFYISRVKKKAKIITLDPTHPAHSLFELLPSGQRYQPPEQPGTPFSSYTLSKHSKPDSKSSHSVKTLALVFYPVGTCSQL